MSPTIVVIHGARTFASRDEYLEYLQGHPMKENDFTDRRDWKAHLSEALHRRHKVLMPRMPGGMSVQYEEWSVMFKRMLPYLGYENILIGHSLGGAFLTKYLSFNDLPKDKRIVGTILVAAPRHEEGRGLLTFEPPRSLERFARQSSEIAIFHSKDDPVVAAAHAKEYEAELSAVKPKHVQMYWFTDRGHFNQEKLPEVVGVIRELAKESLVA